MRFAPETSSADGGDATNADRLSVTRVRHRFGDTEVLHDVSLSIEAGEILCLVGPSGCGKSTLLRLVAGLEYVQQGAIAMDGEVIAGPALHLPPERRGVGLVFQDFALFPHLSIVDNVAFGLAARPRAERRRLALDMLDRIGLADRAEDAPHVLSGGQQQRVALARALLSRPRLMLLDEPFSNLDVRLRQRLRIDTLRLLEESRAATILVTHDPEEAMCMADRIALMRDGRIVQMGSPTDLYRQPVDAFAAEFFGEVNRIHGVARHAEVATPFGPVPARAIGDGAAVEVLVRPEAIVPSNRSDPKSIPARVSAVRVLGAACVVTLEVSAADGEPVSLQAQFSSAQFSPECCDLGATIDVRLNSQGVFVFPVG